MVPTTMLATKGSVVPVKYGMPILIVMALSMAATSSTGKMCIRDRCCAAAPYALT